MDEQLTRVTIWLALALYAASQLVRRRTTASTGMSGLSLLAAGWASFLVHVILAFDVHYGWSHTTAYAETAAQTEALVGLRWGGGLYFNYLFGLVWLAELTWWNREQESYLQRAAWIELTVRGFFLFMIANGAVVFVESPQRWLGAVIVGVLLVAWRPRRP
ncbi:MAG: hypothetical protein QF681_10945 [Vicinamibacterales bacterium]|jgi:hypothetical protein|nr:hypothetical protein [Vicinamibacterales bacterium]